MNKKKLYTLFTLLSTAGYTWIALNVFERSVHLLLPPVCLFKEVTGVPCPSCGTTRSVTALCHGNVKQAFLTNPFGPIMALALLVIPMWIALDTLRRTDSFYRSYTKMERLLATNKWLSISAAVVVLLNWLWNIAKGL